MTEANTDKKTRRDLILFFILAFAFSWGVAIPLALEGTGAIEAALPEWTHYLAAYGPMLAALVVTAFSLGSPGLKDLLGRMFYIRVCPKWWFVSFSPLLTGLLLIFILNRFPGTGITIASLGNVNYLQPLGWGALLLWFLTFGLGEETGWRGFALPRLQKGRTALSATLILTIFWALWHLPQFLYLFEPASAIGWLAGLFAGSIVLTWLYNSASDSIFMVSIWHACFNFMTASTGKTGLLPVLLTLVVIVWAALVVRFAGAKSLMSL